jgi:hypothetical protein
MQQFSRFIILTFIYSSTCFGRCPAHHQELNDCSGSLCFYLRIVVTVVLRSWSGRPARPQILAVSLLTTRFNIQKLYMVLALRCVFCTDLRTDSDFCCIRH